MITRRQWLVGSSSALLVAFATTLAGAQGSPARITILFDAFGKPSALKRGWGYSALIEYGGRRILFDTGAKSADFAANASALGVDLKNLDFVVISHRHNDHTGGLNHVLSENPNVTIYTPFEGAGFNSLTPPGLMNMMKRQVATVPEELRYFGGNPPAENRPEAPWLNARFVQIREQNADRARWERRVTLPEPPVFDSLRNCVSSADASQACPPLQSGACFLHAPARLRAQQRSYQGGNQHEQT